MPPASHALMHPEARLSDTERQALVQGFGAMFGEGENEARDKD
jgi:hypothetical protein